MGTNSGGLAQETESTTVGANELRSGNSEGIELRRVECHLTNSLWKRMLRLIFPDQRKQERLPTPPLVGYLGTACASKPYDLGDISLTGFCLLTGERWIPGTEMPITLHRTNLPAQDDKDSFTVQATVVRSDGEGVGFSIVLSEEESNAVHGNPLRVKWMTKQEMAQFLARLKAQPGSELPKGRSQNPVKTPASTQSGTGAQLNAAFVGGR
ncbi:MAG TPA: PilZ domain-containing protein [Terracidiphilus sp.]|nr:PilZ domain-containing protein [Terracidiphilus sp.]